MFDNRKAFADGRCEPLPATIRRDTSDLAELDRLLALRKRANR
jgi:hypothetical protein